MPTLLLATNVLSEKNELDERLPALSRWAESLQNQKKALSLLEKSLSPLDLLNGTPEQAAYQIAAELAPEPIPVPSS